MRQDLLRLTAESDWTGLLPFRDSEGEMSNELPIVTTSEIKCFDRCPQQWWWSYRCGLKGKAKPADALWFGTGIHIALADWYGEGFDRGRVPWATWTDWVGSEVREIKANLTERDKEWFDEPLYYDAGDLGRAMLHEYVRKYGVDEDWEIIAVEQPFEVELVRNGHTIAIFCGCIDGAFIDHVDDEIYLLENKTAGSIKTAHLPLDGQAGNYFAAGTVTLRHQGNIGPKDNLFGIRYNFLRKSMPDERERNAGGAYLNKDGSVSKKQPPPAFVREPVDRSPREVGSILRRITDKAFLMQQVREGKLPVTKNITDMCPYCPYFTMCVMHERGGNAWKHFRDVQYKVQDPYHEELDKGKSAAE